METIDKLTELFKHFPGIGPRQAKRFVYFLLTRNKSYLKDLTNLIEELPNEVSICKECFRYFAKGKQATTLCNICAGKNRDLDTLMVVARDIDLENVEKSHSFNGKYFVLGGTVPILDKNPETKVRLKELVSLVDKKKIKEIILGFSVNPESEYTAQFIIKALNPLTIKHNIKISHLGRGLSTGTELEYSDSDTIKSAFENRK